MRACVCVIERASMRKDFSGMDSQGERGARTHEQKHRQLHKALYWLHHATTCRGAKGERFRKRGNEREGSVRASES